MENNGKISEFRQAAHFQNGSKMRQRLFDIKMNTKRWSLSMLYDEQMLQTNRKLTIQKYTYTIYNYTPKPQMANHN